VRRGSSGELAEPVDKLLAVDRDDPVAGADWAVRVADGLDEHTVGRGGAVPDADRDAVRGAQRPGRDAPSGHAKEDERKHEERDG
jgi:hypothetical protein